MAADRMTVQRISTIPLRLVRMFSITVSRMHPMKLTQEKPRYANTALTMRNGAATVSVSAATRVQASVPR
jgi:hypothetical protein